MNNNPKTEWASWIAGIASAVIALIALAYSFWPKSSETNPSVTQAASSVGTQIGEVSGGVTINNPTSSSPGVVAAPQTSTGPNSPNIANVQGDVTVNIQAGKSKLDIPSYDFSLQPFPGWRRNPRLGEEFNETMSLYLNKTVYLSISLSEEITKELNLVPDEYGRIIFTVKDDMDLSTLETGGAEYLVHLSKSDKIPFEIRDNIAKLSGYFKIYDINGPRQGYLSVNMRPVEVE